MADVPDWRLSMWNQLGQRFFPNRRPEDVAAFFEQALAEGRVELDFSDAGRFVNFDGHRIGIVARKTDG